MTREQLILTGFIILAVLVFVWVVRHGFQSKRRMCGGVFAMIVLSAAAIAIHCINENNTAALEFRRPVISLSDIGLGVFLILLACLGCISAGSRDS